VNSAQNRHKKFNISVEVKQWNRISHKQSAKWQYLSWLKGSTFFSLQKNSCKEAQQLILGIGNAIYWLSEPY
jgi:hypothetical protein